MLALVMLLAAIGAQAQAVFRPQPVGSAAPEQDVTVTATTAGTVQTVAVLTLGASGLDFAAGTGASTCASATLAAGGTCAEPVTFTPAAPGLRLGAVVLLDSNSIVLGTSYVYGTGLGGLGVLVPGNLLPVAGQESLYTVLQDNGPATSAELNLPASVALDGAGNMYIADSLHNRIRMVCASATSATIRGATCTGAGIISTIVGNGNSTYTGDGGLAAGATLNTPNGVALDGAGNLYIADSGNNRIRKVTAATGIITTVAGNGMPGTSTSVGDGSAATLANLNQPWGVTLDGSGNLVVADTANHRIRRVDAVTGVITTVAGSGFMHPDGTGGFSGDGGPATSAELNRPFAVAFDLAGNMYIPDSANNRVRMVAAVSGVITTFAGTGAAGYTGDGQAANLGKLWSPSGVAVDPAGNVYIADTQNTAIRKVNSATGFISTLAVNGTGEFLFNGSFEPMMLYGPIGLYLDGRGNLFVADYYNMVVREIQSNFVALDYTTTPVRQGDKSTPKSQTVENDGNAALDLTAITHDANAAVDAASTTCTTGNPLLGVAGDCTIGAVFAPSAAGNPLSGNIDVAEDTVAGLAALNSPLDIQLVGNATAVNSTTITVASSLNPSGFGQPVTFTATVTTGATTGNLTGTVTFYDGATTLAAGVALNAPGTTAKATFTTSSLTVGLHTITASYSGDTSHFPSTSTDNNAKPLIQTVLEATAVGLTSSLNPSAVGQNVTFTATVAISGGGGVAPDGTVVFTDGATTLGSVPINAGGVATYATAALAAGVHTIVATYGGDAAKQILGSTSNTVSQDVQSPSAIAVTSSLNPSNYGIPVTFTATVTPSGTVAATGTVKFLDNGQQIGTGTLAGSPGTATFTTSTLIVGSHPITVTYAGDTFNGPSTSLPITQAVNQTQTSTAEAAAPSPGIAGAPVAVTATVKVIAGAATTTGTVTFTNGAATLGSATLGAAGTATINPTLPPGQYSIIATYGGDANDSGSASAPLALTVQLATTSIAVTTSGSPALVLSPITFTATVTGNGGIPTGTVTFLSDGVSIGVANLSATGTAAFTTSALAAGTHSITASYGGDVNDSPSTSAAISQAVGTIQTVTDLGTATTTGTSPQTILVATVLASTGPVPTGTITFNNGTTTIGSAPLDSSGVATLTPNLALGTYTIVAVYSGDVLHSPSTSQPVTISGTATGFNLAVTPASVTMAATQNATVTVTLTSSNGFADTIGLGCASLPAGVTCHFSSPSVSLAANGVATAQLQIDTNSPLTGGSSAMNSHGGSGGAYLAGLFLPFSVFFGWIFWRLRKRQILTAVLILVLSAAAMVATGCSGFSSNSAAPGTYVIQVTGTGANSNVIHYQNVTLIVTK